MQSQTDRLNAALAGRYSIERQLGAGGMATVYLAQDLKHDRRVAIKVMRPDVSADVGADRFLAEIRTTANLQHPHIVPIFDSGRADDQLYFVMPLVDGESLRARLDREIRLPVTDAVRIVREVAGALDYAHGQGVLHRDLKPENIMLSRGHALLADFGIARTAHSESARLTQTGTSLGTPAYMSPEQATGERELGPASDVYGLGAILFELLTGEPPFTGATFEAILVKRFTEDAPRCATKRADTPASCDAAIAKALACDPAQRFGSARAFSEALGEAATSPKAATERSIAVLPFANLSTDAENGYFADGLTEEVITTLSKVRSLRVISRTTVMQYRARTASLRDIARELGVTHLLEGSVRKGGDRLRISASLVDAERDTSLWSDRFDGSLADVFDMQDRVAAAIVTALSITLSTEERSRLVERPIENPQAYDAYLRAREGLNAFTTTGLQRAFAHLDEASRIAPDSVFLIRSKARAHWWAVNFALSTDVSLLDKALAYADEIARLEPGSPYVAEIRGLVGVLRGQGQKALSDLGVAYESMPEDLDIAFWYGAVLIYAGRIDAGMALIRDVLRREPTHPLVPLMVIVGEQMAGHPERPVSRFAAGPGTAFGTFWYLLQGMAALAAGDRSQATIALDLSAAQPPDMVTAMAGFLATACRGDASGFTSQVEEGSWNDLSYAEIVAEGFALLGDAEQAAKWLGRAVDLLFGCHDGLVKHNAVWRSWLTHPLLEPEFEKLRVQAERFQAIPIAPRLAAQLERSAH